MKCCIWAAIALSFATVAHAEIPLVLAEACAKLDTESQRIECLRAAAGTAGAAAEEKTPSAAPAWAAVERAFISMDGALSAGSVSLNSYQPMILEASKELALLEHEAPDAGAAIAGLKFALEAHQDALRFWGEDIRFYARSDNRLAYSGGLPMKMVGLESMIDRYALPTQNSDIWGLNRGVQRTAGLSRIWSIAKQRSDEVFAQLKAPPQQ